jgi:hypothetical protein
MWAGITQSVQQLTKVQKSNPSAQRGVIFSAPFQTSPGAHLASYTMGTGSFPGVMWPGPGIDHSPPPSTKVKERVELYLYMIIL